MDTSNKGYPPSPCPYCGAEDGGEVEVETEYLEREGEYGEETLFFDCRKCRVSLQWEDSYFGDTEALKDRGVEVSPIVFTRNLKDGAGYWAIPNILDPRWSGPVDRHHQRQAEMLLVEILQKGQFPQNRPKN